MYVYKFCVTIDYITYIHVGCKFELKLSKNAKKYRQFHALVSQECSTVYKITPDCHIIDSLHTFSCPCLATHPSSWIPVMKMGTSPFLWPLPPLTLIPMHSLKPCWKFKYQYIKIITLRISYAKISSYFLFFFTHLKPKCYRFYTVLYILKLKQRSDMKCGPLNYSRRWPCQALSCMVYTWYTPGPYFMSERCFRCNIAQCTNPSCTQHFSL